jgi:hypothetical protein
MLENIGEPFEEWIQCFGPQATVTPRLAGCNRSPGNNKNDASNKRDYAPD